MYNQNTKAYSLKINQLNSKEKQEMLQREEAKAQHNQELIQAQHEGEELRLAIADHRKRSEALRISLEKANETECRRLESLNKEAAELDILLSSLEQIHNFSNSVSYTHLTLPTILLVQISVVAVSLKKKKKTQLKRSHP
eukprot:TRINITY_DN426_c0_g1_i3.p3 TRINITY_DN426_c0_g1~~TRINITY_DN426_c0_g1_i3.p3  ORF type:complete len:140 (-),score=35.19 TRINITY_DN426_c0_g1_i3:62-481(-)